MGTTPATSADIETLIENYATLRRPEDPTPPQLLRKLHRDINSTVLPCVTSLHERSMAADWALEEFSKSVVTTDKKATNAMVQGAKRAEKTGREIEREVEKIRGELKSVPPDSPRRDFLLKAMKLRLGDFELLEKRVEGYKHRIEESQRKFRELIPTVADIQKRANALRGKFRKAMFWLAFRDISAKLILGLPLVIAFFSTLALDRATWMLELLTAKVAPKSSHDIALLVVFVAQILGLTPITDAISTKLCWRSFDSAMNTVRSLLPIARAVETGLADVEQRLASLSFDDPSG